MNNFEELVNELQSIDSQLANHSVMIQREQSEITNTMNKAQGTFCGAGQGLVTTLYRIMQNSIVADSSLNLVREEIRECIYNLQK